MSAESIGSMRVDLLARVGDAEPTVLAQVIVPIVPRGPTGQLVVDIAGHLEYASALLKTAFARTDEDAES